MSSRPPVPRSLNELIRSLDGLDWDGLPDLDNICYLVESYESNRADWQPFANTRQGDAYTRNHVYEKPGKFNVLILCWQPKQGSKIHAHQGSDCFLKVLQGEFREEQFYKPEKNACPLNLKQDIVYTLNQVNHMTDEKGLHRVTNNSDSVLAVSLHVYVPPFSECKWYEEETGKENIAQMSYYSYSGVIKGDHNALADSKSPLCKDEGSRCRDGCEVKSCKTKCSEKPRSGPNMSCNGQCLIGTMACMTIDGQCCEETKACMTSDDQCCEKTKPCMTSDGQCCGKTKACMTSDGQCCGKTKACMTSDGQCCEKTKPSMTSDGQCCEKTKPSMTCDGQCCQDTKQCSC